MQEAQPLLLAQAEQGAEETIASRAEYKETVEAEEEVEADELPISLGLSYALYSDYIFRGVNFSEYPGEGTERLNHQMTASVAWNTGDWGTFGFDAWFEWFGGQKKIDPVRGGQNLQEVDYVVWWSYFLEDIETDFTLGYTYYLFPNLSYTLNQDGAPGNNNDDRTMEWWFSLEHNDAWMWKWLWPENEEGVLNPSFMLAHDVGEILGVWMEFGISHDFTIPNVENLTITPGWMVAGDCNYWAEGFQLAGEQVSLVTAYDLTPVLKLPDWAGTLTVTGDLYFWDAWGDMEDNDVMQDEFWGGVTVNWSWGG
jgi:hypothetical protein